MGRGDETDYTTIDAGDLHDMGSRVQVELHDILRNNGLSVCVRHGRCSMHYKYIRNTLLHGITTLVLPLARLSCLGAQLYCRAWQPKAA